MTGPSAAVTTMCVFLHLQYATHHGAAALSVVVQQAQSAQSLLVPLPVLGRVQHTVTAQNLQHTHTQQLKSTENTDVHVTLVDSEGNCKKRCPSWKRHKWGKEKSVTFTFLFQTNGCCYLLI